MSNDATQKLVDELREALAAERAAAYAQLDSEDFEECIEATDSALAALEAAQRPPVSAEVRDELAFTIAEHRRGVGARPHRLEAELADTLLARFSLPPVSPEQRNALDVLIADVLIAERDEWPRDPGDAPSEVLAGAVTDAILARFTIPVLDTDSLRAEK